MEYKIQEIDSKTLKIQDKSQIFHPKAHFGLRFGLNSLFPIFHNIIYVSALCHLQY